MTRRIAETYAARGVVVVGMGADGWVGLGENSRHALRQAGAIIGSPRQLEQLPGWLGAQRQEWLSPRREDIRALIETHADAGVAVLASGDPLLYGIGRTLVEELGIDRLLFLPNLSSVALACARMGWPVESVTVVNAPSGGLDTLPGHLAEGARIVVLSAGRDTPAAVAARLVEAGYGDSSLVVLGDLGTNREGRWEGTASAWDAEVTSGLNVVAVDCRGRGAPGTGAPGAAAPGARVPRAAAAPEAAALSDTAGAPGIAGPPDARPPGGATAGQQAGAGRVSTYGAARLTELGPLVPDPAAELTDPARPAGPAGASAGPGTPPTTSGAPAPGGGGSGAAEAVLSAAVLVSLDPAPGEMLWEIGGSGAAAIAWSMAAAGARAAVIAGTDVPERATPFGIPPIRWATGALPGAAAGLPIPDAVLLVDASAAPGVMETTWRALRSGGRLVGVATTLDEAAVLARYHRILGGELTRLSLAVGRSLGEGSQFAAARELVLWVRHKSPAARASAGA